MSDIKIYVLHTGAVCVAPDLPFGGDHCNAIKASDIFQPREAEAELQRQARQAMKAQRKADRKQKVEERRAAIKAGFDGLRPKSN